MMRLTPSPVTLRPADTADLVAVERLAQLDSQPLPPGPYLLAERRGQVDAALSLATGVIVADPFKRTAELCDLLRCHAAAMHATFGEQTWPARLQPRPRLITA